MADYREMYRRLFAASLEAAEIIKKAHQEAEELFLDSSEEDNIIVMNNEHGTGNNDGS